MLVDAPAAAAAAAASAAALSERKYYARCLESFSSETLRAFLAHLHEIDPDRFAMRNGGESFHIDFNALPEPTYVAVRDFIARQLPVDPADLEDETSAAAADAPPPLVSSAAMPANGGVAWFVNGARRFRAPHDQYFSVDGFPIRLVGTGTATDRPYVCQTCNAQFATKNKCVDHIRYIHAKAHQAQCDVCAAKLKNKHYLKEHKKRMHSVAADAPGVAVAAAPPVVAAPVPMVVVVAAEKTTTTTTAAARPDRCQCKTGCKGNRCGCTRAGRRCGAQCSCVSCENRDAA